MIKKKPILYGVALFVALLLSASLFFLCSCEKSDKVRVGCLYGPTSVSLLQFTGNDNYEIKTVAQTDAIVADIASKKLDIALMPSNLASNLYAKTNGGIKVIDVNTTGVLKFISQDTTIDTLQGKTLYTTGKETIVQATLDMLLDAKNLTEKDLNVVYKSDASEVIAYLKNDPTAIGLVNEPQASIALESFTDLREIWDINDLWHGIYGLDSDILTAVTIVRTDYLMENQSKVDAFLKEHKSSISFVKNNPGVAASIFNKKFTETGITATERSIINLNLKFIEGQELKDKLGEFLNKIYKYNPKLVGNQVPDENFYYEAGQNLNEEEDNG